jgi:flagellar biogenesis protein FliO
MKQMGNEDVRTAQPVGGLAGWLLGRIHAGRRTQPRLELIDKISLAPRQSLALVEAEGRRFLVATSPEGAPAFYPLEGAGTRTGLGQKMPAGRKSKSFGEQSLAGRVSW